MNRSEQEIEDLVESWLPDLERAFETNRVGPREQRFTHMKVEGHGMEVFTQLLGGKPRRVWVGPREPKSWKAFLVYVLTFHNICHDVAEVKVTFFEMDDPIRWSSRTSPEVKARLGQPTATHI